MSAESVGCWRNRVGFGIGQLDDLLSLAELRVSPLKTGGQLCPSFRLVLQVRENSIGGTKTVLGSCGVLLNVSSFPALFLDVL